jgi:hypothetical protein
MAGLGLNVGQDLDQGRSKRRSGCWCCGAAGPLAFASFSSLASFILITSLFFIPRPRIFLRDGIHAVIRLGLVSCGRGRPTTTTSHRWPGCLLVRHWSQQYQHYLSLWRSLFFYCNRRHVQHDDNNHRHHYRISRHHHRSLVTWSSLDNGVLMRRPKLLGLVRRLGGRLSPRAAAAVVADNDDDACR